MKKTLGVVAAAALAAAPAVAVFAADGNTTLTDTVEVKIESACSIAYDTTPTGYTTGGHKAGKVSNDTEAAATTWTGNTVSGTMANNTASSDYGSTAFVVVCNDDGGSYVTFTAANLVGGTHTANTIGYGTTIQAGTSNYAIKSSGNWLSTGDKVWNKKDATDATSGKFTVTYGVSLDTDQEADTYSGDVVYTLVHPDTD